ncbi:cobalt ECF transporter T component CbiQ [Paenibacillus sp. MMS18-CY102]|uniref:cobalt ECF transporter T component CbiQ n=1 Tax=Paenibacillus sp. MMS18-CY102 TaxID=2682849 RepID=UPI0013667BAD|nr:cobalt ECF transporter T component CbiQ [Paenibacillus sp. MMS18-CY102]MWC30609.1 cobalt ECF transporter T component CbiQ [Paenibacillus sp. MMS18-CY102]
MIKRIDSLSYNNKLRNVAPMWKFTFAAALFTLSYLSHPIIQLAIMGWMFVWVVVYARIPIKQYVLLLTLPCLFYAASLPALVLEIEPISSGSAASGKVLLTAFHWAVTLSDSNVWMAVQLFVRVAACLSCLTFVTLTLPISELFQVFKKLRMPALVLELMLIMYRFLFLLMDTASRMYAAQVARGGHSSFRSKIKDMAMLIVRLFDKTMQRYKGVSNGLVARGFTNEILMPPYHAMPMPARYKWEGYIGFVVLALIEAWNRWRGIR